MSTMRYRQIGGSTPLGNVLFYCLCIGLVVCGMLLYIWTHLQVVKLGYLMDDMQRKWDNATQLRKAMDLEIASLRSLRRIERIAKNQLGMEVPSPGRLITLRHGGGDGEVSDKEREGGR